MVGALLIDLDGVLRDWPPDDAAVDRLKGLGLSLDTVNAALFDPDLLHRVVTGAITDEAWQLEAADQLRATHGVECGEALLAGRAYPGRLRPDVLDVCRRVRQHVPVSLLTNATSRLADHLHQLALATEFDRVFNSSEMGVAKPDTRIFERACDELRLTPDEVVFVDDTEGHVRAAASIGLRAHLFTTAAELEQILANEGILDS